MKQTVRSPNFKDFIAMHVRFEIRARSSAPSIARPAANSDYSPANSITQLTRPGRIARAARHGVPQYISMVHS